MAKKKPRIEKNTQIILGALGLFVTLVWVLSSFNLGDWSHYTFQATGIALFLILIVEGGVMSYFRSQRYKKIDVKDFVIWLNAGIAFMVLLNSITGFQIVKKAFPEAMITFLGNIAGTVGIIAGIMIIIHMITPKFEG